MGKGKKDKKKDKAGKAEKAVSGLKLSKQLRKATSIAADLAREPVVSEVVAAALLSAAAALRDNKKAGRAAAAAGGQVAEGAAEAGKQAGKVGEALRDLAIDLARRTLDNWERPAGGGKGGGKASGTPDKG